MLTLLVVLAAITATVVAATLGLAYLLARQVLAVRPGTTLLAVVAGLLSTELAGIVVGLLVAAWLQVDGRRSRGVRVPSPTGRRRARGRRGAVVVVEPSRLARPWSGLVTDALAARARYAAAVAAAAPGPLREQIAALGDEVDAKVGQVWKLATAGDAITRAHDEVAAGLRSQRRRAGLFGPRDVAERSRMALQHDSAARLAAAVGREAARVRGIVADLDAAAATALELSTATVAPATPPLDGLADRLAALRAGAREVDELVA